MNDTKSILLSKTFWGVIVMLLGRFLPHFGITLSDSDQAGLADQLVSLVGAGLAVYGRVTASKGVSIGKGSGSQAGHVSMGICTALVALLVSVSTVYILGCAGTGSPVSDQALSQQQSAVQYLQLSESAMDATLSILSSKGVEISEAVTKAIDTYKAGVTDYAQAVKDCATTDEVDRKWVVVRSALTAAADLVAQITK